VELLSISPRDSSTSKRGELTRSSTFDGSKGRPGPSAIKDKNAKQKSTLPLPRRNSRSRELEVQHKRNSSPQIEFSQ